MSTIKAIRAREILNGLGEPSLEVIVWLDDNRSVISSVGTQPLYTPNHAHIKTDGASDSFQAKKLTQAVELVNGTIAPELEGKTPINQTQIDQTLVNLDGTKDKSKLGANTILAVSQAVMKAGALSVNLPLYSYLQQKYSLTDYFSLPNCIYDILHGGPLGNKNLDLQEFEVIPASSISFPQSLDMAAKIRQQTQALIQAKGGFRCESMTGGFLPQFNSNTDALDLLIEAIKISDYTFAQDIFLGIDAGAQFLSSNNRYELKDKIDHYNSKDMIEYYRQIREHYKVIYIEDPLAEDDLEDWQSLTTTLGATTKISLDTAAQGNLKKIKKAISKNQANTLNIKPIDVGTMTETVQQIKLARDASWQIVISHIPGETNDDFLADLAVGTGSEFVKFGTPARGENTAKYNRLLHIYHEIKQYLS